MLRLTIMTLPAATQPIFREPQFWSDYFWQTEVPSGEAGYADLVNCEVPLTDEEAARFRRYGIERDAHRYCRYDFAVGDDCSLSLEFDPRISQVCLFLCDSSDRTQIAWDDQAHWHPHVLRWQELELVCLCAALREPSLIHPGLPLLLLHRFAPITECEHAERALRLIRDAWRSLGVFSESKVKEFASHWDFRGNGFEWRQDQETGWTLHQDDQLRYNMDLYSLRWAQNPDFPHSRFRDMVNAAQRSCAGLVRSEWIQAKAGTVFRLASALETSGSSGDLPVLADALEEVGCDNAAVLSHCRRASPTWESSWVVDMLLGKSWTTA
jgi:hypothetical protein